MWQAFLIQIVIAIIKALIERHSPAASGVQASLESAKAAASSGDMGPLRALVRALTAHVRG